MKEIKAYIKTIRLEKVIQALERAGVPGITVVEVHPVGYGFDINYFSSARESIKRYFEIAKIELVVGDREVDRLIEIIQHESHTGYKGDGMVFVTPVEKAVKIRTGTEGEAALAE